MKTEYVQTEFEKITPGIKRAWEIKSHAQGKRLIPLAKGEKPPEDMVDSEAPHLLNHAAPEELQSICGIGEELADAIVAYREDNGPYRSAEDLEPIPGIGPSTARKLWDHGDG